MARLIYLNLHLLNLLIELQNLSPEQNRFGLTTLTEKSVRVSLSKSFDIIFLDYVYKYFVVSALLG